MAVTNYDFRELPSGDTTTLPIDIWLTTSTNGGQSFGSELHFAGPFDMKRPRTRWGFFVGAGEAANTAWPTSRHDEIHLTARAGSGVEDPQRPNYRPPPSHK